MKKRVSTYVLIDCFYAKKERRCLCASLIQIASKNLHILGKREREGEREGDKSCVGSSVGMCIC